MQGHIHGPELSDTLLKNMWMSHLVLNGWLLLLSHSGVNGRLCIVINAWCVRALEMPALASIED